MKIEPNISHGLKIDPIKFQIWKLQLYKYLSLAAPMRATAPILMGFQKSGRPYRKGISKKRLPLS
jgi:hypothetical protein